MHQRVGGYNSVWGPMHYVCHMTQRWCLTNHPPNIHQPTTQFKKAWTKPFLLSRQLLPSVVLRVREGSGKSHLWPAFFLLSLFLQGPRMNMVQYLTVCPKCVFFHLLYGIWEAIWNGCWATETVAVVFYPDSWSTFATSIMFSFMGGYLWCIVLVWS